MKWERDSEYSWVSGGYRIIAGKSLCAWRFVLLFKDQYLGKVAKDSETVKKRAEAHSKEQ